MAEGKQNDGCWRHAVVDNDAADGEEKQEAQGLEEVNGVVWCGVCVCLCVCLFVCLS